MIKVQDDLASGTVAKGGCLSLMTPGFKEANPPTQLRAGCQINEPLAAEPRAPS